MGKLNQQLVKNYQVGNYPEATIWAEKALTYARKSLGEKHPNTLTSMNNLALLYQSQGRYDHAELLYLTFRTQDRSRSIFYRSRSRHVIT